MTTIFINNKLNSCKHNPPGYDVWVGGVLHGDEESGAVKVGKEETNVEFNISDKVLCNGNLLTFALLGQQGVIKGPFNNGDKVDVPMVVDSSDEEDSFHLEGTEFKPASASSTCQT